MKKSIFNFVITIGCLGALVACSSESTPLPAASASQDSQCDINHQAIDSTSFLIETQLDSVFDSSEDFESTTLDQETKINELMVSNNYLTCSGDGNLSSIPQHCTNDKLISYLNAQKNAEPLRRDLTKTYDARITQLEITLREVKREIRTLRSFL